MLAILRKTTDALFDTNRRFRQARLFHATRVALALLASIALTTGIDIPHGEWATITVLVVIGGLQHHGNIRRRAAERGIGTLIGALIGLALIVQQSFFGQPLLTYALLALICGYCAYHAIGQGGYIALLAAITVVITAGHGEQNIADAFWRTADVFIGTAIALVFSFALPAYASYSWRIRLAGLLRASMAVHTRMQHGFADSAELRAAMVELGAKLIPLRGLIPSVAKETGVPAAEFEEIQHGARVCISALELMATIEFEDGLREGNDPGIDAALLAMADALETGQAPLPASAPGVVVAELEPGPLPIMARRLAGELASLRTRLDRLSREYGFPYAAPRL
ncbi:FUSC family protein [Cupriavidus consociatus]|uniref:FUSC family protein n=1 Tax=Cupriavidus consociatus TaxID=2821357 RepID=UPI001AE8428E|nr:MULTISPECIES: FUSC family protein [unclassified Cupriavidus]MBP0624868.1 FUSC family protein [Cupriavidus sp. LEh25]MDK2661595.1 FUSC family protein [Cupriavidus sp. LEh21]